MNKHDYPTSIRFNAQTDVYLRALQAKLGLKRSQIVALAVARLAELERVSTEQQEVTNRMPSR